MRVKGYFGINNADVVPKNDNPNTKARKTTPYLFTTFHSAIHSFSDHNFMR